MYPLRVVLIVALSPLRCQRKTPRLAPLSSPDARPSPRSYPPFLSPRRCEHSYTTEPHSGSREGSVGPLLPQLQFKVVGFVAVGGDGQRGLAGAAVFGGQ